ncbi:hypothetical protein WJX72_000951 [[Myrmecia] bisecta]|uniref:Uncharacterized protein n=1 Tax=[Myrmecia] bisecta TaxID=41462 RepID=A0AAW1R4N5_9CHLO
MPGTSSVRQVEVLDKALEQTAELKQELARRGLLSTAFDRKYFVDHVLDDTSLGQASSAAAQRLLAQVKLRRQQSQERHHLQHVATTFDLDRQRIQLDKLKELTNQQRQTLKESTAASAARQSNAASQQHEDADDSGTDASEEDDESGSSEEDDTEEGEDESDDDEESETEHESEAESEEAASGIDSEEAPRATAKPGVHEQVALLQNKRQRVLASLPQVLPQAQARLAKLKREHVSFQEALQARHQPALPLSASAALSWRRTAPPDVLLMAADLVDDLVEGAMRRLEMRPQAADILGQIFEWQHARGEALDSLCRSLAARVLEEACDSMLQQIVVDLQREHEAAQQFACSMLTGTIGQAHGRGAALAEAAKAAQKAARLQQRGAPQQPHRDPPNPGLDALIFQTSITVEAIHADIQSQTAGVVVDGDEMDAEAVQASAYFRDLDGQQAATTDRQDGPQYLQALQGMLRGMQGAKRGQANGVLIHTQQLDVRFSPGATVTKAQYVAASKQGAPAAAQAAVVLAKAWRAVSVAPAGPPLAKHQAAAAGEHSYWRQVAVTPLPGPSGEAGLLPKTAGSVTCLRIAPCGLAWSQDSWQVASLDVLGNVRVWAVKPAAESAQLDDAKAPKYVEPILLLSVAAAQLASTGKLPVDQEGDESAAPLPASQQPLLFHLDTTATASQPWVLVPQNTGDLVGVAPAPPPMVLSTARLGNPAARPPDASTCAYLSPALQPDATTTSRVMYRGHRDTVMFAGFPHGSATLLTVDSRGEVLLWPACDEQRTGLGWFAPLTRFKMASTIRTAFPRAGLLDIFPAPATRAGKPGQPAGELDAPEVYAQQGEGLLQGKVEWMVRYRPAAGSKPGSKMLREVIHRPATDSGPQTLVYSAYDTSIPDAPRLVTRLKQQCGVSAANLRVVAGELSADGQLLLLVSAVQALPTDGPAPFSFFTCQVFSLYTPTTQGPRIDVYDSSGGQLPPAFALHGTVDTLGSAFLLFGLSSSHIGVYSLATGQLVREVALGSSPSSAPILALQLFTVSSERGGSPQAEQQLLATASANADRVSLYRLDHTPAAEACINRRLASMVVRRVTRPQTMPATSTEEDESSEDEETDEEDTEEEDESTEEDSS